MRYRALLTVLLLSGMAGGADASTEAPQCGRSQAGAESPQPLPLPLRDGPAQP
jgi:hypothetical protein